MVPRSFPLAGSLRNGLDRFHWSKYFEILGCGRTDGVSKTHLVFLRLIPSLSGLALTAGVTVQR